jgi:hypothetical protein
MAQTGNAALLLVAGVVLATGSGLALSGRTPALRAPEPAKEKKAKDETDASKGAQKAASGRKDPFCPLERFAGIDPDEEPVSDDGARAKRILGRLKALGYSPHVRILLATVPDPQDSRFAKLFDDLVSAIRTALENSDFVDDRFTDVWRPGLLGADGKALRREQPTTLLFRNAQVHPDASDETHELVAVLLVGESPAWGVHRKALGAALSFAQTMFAAEGPARPEDRRRLSVLGPTLSGTTESLRVTIANWFANACVVEGPANNCGHDPVPFDLTFISGTATSDENQRVLETDLSELINQQVGSIRPFASSFQATLHPDEAQKDFVIRYLAGLRIRRIALLTESSTTYGAGVGRTSKLPSACTVIDLPFPLHISKLRHELDLQQGEAAEAASPDFKGKLALERADDVDVDEDAYPAKSRVTQAVSAISLEQTLRAIATEDVQAVVIAASSSSDAIFLVAKVRQSFPNVTIVINGSDLAYLHEDVSFMEGTLIASTYPLIPWTQCLDFPFKGDETRLLFPSEAAEGVYNATVMLLADLTRQSPERRIVDYGPPYAIPAPGASTAPGHWMSVISRGTFWPVRVEPPGARSRRYVRKFEVGRPIDEKMINQELWTPPRSFVFRFANVVLFLLNVLLVFALFKGVFREPTSFPHKQIHRGAIAMLVLIAFLVSAGFFAVDLATVLPKSCVHRWWESVLVFLFGALVLLLLALTVHSLVACVLPATEGGARRRLMVFVGTLAGGAIMAMIGGARMYALRTATHGERITTFMLFLERARNLDSGMSLLWSGSLVGVGLALWALGRLRQVRIVEDAAVLRTYGVIPPKPDEAASGAGEGPQVEQVLVDAIALHGPMYEMVTTAEAVFPSQLGWIFIIIVFVDTLWVSRRLILFEHWMWGGSCALGYALLLTFIVYGCDRYLRTWRAMQLVLAKVAPSGMTEALKRVPVELIASFKRPWDAEVFEVWINHCQPVFAQLAAKEELFPAAAKALGMEEKDLRALVAKSRLPRDGAAANMSAKKARLLWEDFLAMRLVALVHYLRTHLSNYIAVSTAALLAAFWATNFYPLGENRFLLLLVLFVGAAAVSIAATVFVQMNKNYVLSKMEGTSAGHVSWDSEFVTNIFVHVALPLLTLLAVKFPELGRSWSTIGSALSRTGGS